MAELDNRSYTWASMLDAIQHGKPHPKWPKCYSLNENHKPERQWDLNLGFSGALALAKGQRQWPEGRAIIERLAREQATRALRTRPSLDYAPDVEGQYFDVGLVVQGQPECWMTPVVSNTGDRSAVKLVINMSTSAVCPATTMAERMQAACATVLTLDALGVPTEVWAVAYQTGGYAPPRVFRHHTTVLIKDAGQALDIHRLTCVAHPAFYRRLWFRIMELTPDDEHAAYGWPGYGSPADPSPADKLAWYGPQGYYIPMVLWADIQPTIRALAELLRPRLRGAA